MSYQMKGYRMSPQQRIGRQILELRSPEGIFYSVRFSPSEGSKYPCPNGFFHMQTKKAEYSIKVNGKWSENFETVTELIDFLLIELAGQNDHTH
jgi:hypothetical protein